MKKENFEKSGICEKKVNEIIGIAFDGNDYLVDINYETFN